MYSLVGKYYYDAVIISSDFNRIYNVYSPHITNDEGFNVQTILNI